MIPENIIKDKPRLYKSGINSFLWEVSKIVIIALVIIAPLRYYIVQPFFVRGASMEPTFDNGDYILIDEISYRFNDPKRGDIIVFSSPDGSPRSFFGKITLGLFSSGTNSRFLIKRVIGLPNESISIIDNEVVVYNDEYPEGYVLDESYLTPIQKTIGDYSVNLDDSHYYVLGDNRLQSSDSRVFGPVEKSLITGRVLLRAWPFNKLKKF